jgi:hypothetical protein
MDELRREIIDKLITDEDLEQIIILKHDVDRGRMLMSIDRVKFDDLVWRAGFKLGREIAPVVGWNRALWRASNG